MKWRAKTAIVLVLMALIVGGLIGCIQNMSPVWAKVKPETEMEWYHTYDANYHNGKVYYGEYGTVTEFTELDLLSGEEKVIRLDYGENFGEQLENVKSIEQITVDKGGNFYGVVLVSVETESVVTLRYRVPYLCKFSPKGKLIYATDISEQIGETGAGAWNSSFRLEVDEKGRACLAHPTRLFLYDESGNFDKVIGVNYDAGVISNGVMDLATGQDGKVYVYYYGNGYRLSQIDYDAGELVLHQDVMPGELFCFDAEDGFYVGTSSSLYRYDTTMPVAGRTARRLFDWWDLLIYGDTVTMIEIPAEDCIMVIISSILEDRGGVYLIRKMPLWKAKEGGYTYVE